MDIEESELLNGLLIYLSFCVNEAINHMLIGVFKSCCSKPFLRVRPWANSCNQRLPDVDSDLKWKRKECDQWPSRVSTISCTFLTLLGYLCGFSTLQVIIPCVLKIIPGFLQQVVKHFLKIYCMPCASSCAKQFPPCWLSLTLCLSGDLSRKRSKTPSWMPFGLGFAQCWDKSSLVN